MALQQNTDVTVLAYVPKTGRDGSMEFGEFCKISVVNNITIQT